MDELSDKPPEATKAAGEKFVECVRQYEGRVTRFVLLLCRDPDLAEEITQEAFTKAWKSWSQFEERGQCAVSWLLRIARSTFIDHCRRRKIHNAVDAEFKDNRDTPIDELLKAETDRLLRQAINDLSEQERVVVQLRVDKGLKFAEIADELKISEKAANMRFLRAQGRLRQVFERSNLRLGQ